MKKGPQLLIWFILSHVVYGQAPATTQSNSTELRLIKTRSGKSFVGKIVMENDSSLTLQVENNSGESFANIPKKEIIETKKVSAAEVVNGHYWGKISNISYVFSPSGYSLRKGEWYYQNLWVVYNQLNVGITNNIQVGVGGVIPAGMLWGNVRLSIPIIANKITVGASFMYSSFSLGRILITDEKRFIIGYGFGTFGSPNANITVGYGQFYNSENTTQPLLIVSGAIRASKSILLVSENYIGGRANNQTHSFGIRGGRKTVSLTAGIFFNSSNRLTVLPWLGLGLRFGKK